MMTVYEVHPVNPQKRGLEAAARILSADGGTAVYPTDSVYGLGACVTNIKGIEKIARMLEKDKTRPFSFICSDFSQISKYVKVSNAHYRLMKRCLPGPYTFILDATNLVPKRIMPKRKTVGIRMPDCTVVLKLVALLGEPLANTSINIAGELANDPLEIKAAVQHEVDVMLSAGPLDSPEPSTVVDLTGPAPVVVRMGKGEWDENWD
ncbi:MAG: L-threonylcarbamoyladenylate synthase [Chitinispirillia bacterium]|nr:L-threonylcarbamoyladenylate synthase [Chitinispirillia bacterium]MCL2241655.1 L-threonylcarbamoyladenylate synthase [Chitinispirillia bacterium]